MKKKTKNKNELLCLLEDSPVIKDGDDESRIKFEDWKSEVAEKLLDYLSFEWWEPKADKKELYFDKLPERLLALVSPHGEEIEALKERVRKLEKMLLKHQHKDKEVIANLGDVYNGF
jgi:hypothetical protein